MNFEEKAKQIWQDCEIYWTQDEFIHCDKSREEIESDIATALREAYEAGKNESNTPSEYVRGYEQGLKVGRAEASKLVEALMLEKNNMRLPIPNTGHYELWEAAKKSREELMERWGMCDDHSNR
jgi:flagellar biosynthesis/type III secretory pathway protein FliH